MPRRGDRDRLEARIEREPAPGLAASGPGRSATEPEHDGIPGPQERRGAPDGAVRVMRSVMAEEDRTHGSEPVAGAVGVVDVALSGHRGICEPMTIVRSSGRPK